MRAAALLIDSAPSSGRRPLTLRAIADAADTPVASIYHYFPDVDSITAAVADQYGNELFSAVEAGLSRPTESLRGLLDTIFTIYREFFAARPGLRELWFDRRASDKVVGIHRDFRANLAKLLHARMLEFTTKSHDILAYQIWIEITGVLWELAFQHDPGGDPRVVTEIREVSDRFLRRRLGVTLSSPDGEDRKNPEPDSSRVNRSTSAAQTEGPAPHAWESRLPPQARGRKNRAQILSAATEIIDSQGPHGPDLSARAIAEAAGTSPASMYRYFKDLDSLIAAVAAEYMHDLLALLDQVEAGSEGLDYSELNRRTMVAYRDFFARRRGLRELWFDRRASEKVQEVHAHYRRVLAEHNYDAMSRYASLPGDLFSQILNIEVTGALWDLAFTLDPKGHPYVVGEIEELNIDFVQRFCEGKS
ncbi:TetR/AcrR family transcriptional regulator [Amycolatopsis sp. NPDC051372]|uniref:TetR/AcrR family transcriptional regulator n=1 Tax=unclassified Amycolatopsis TaxID=2618356 RepID=UPI0034259D0F